MIGTVIILLAIMAMLALIGSLFEKKKPKVDNALRTTALIVLFVGILAINILMFFQLDTIVKDTDKCIGQYENHVIYETKDKEYYFVKWNHFKCWDMFDKEYIKIDNVENDVKPFSESEDITY